ncbi:phage minor head protein [Bradyrhizobium sp. BEA-2-5]|uniref:phage head morphogenesis protein n=1 Tax=Bradyrhizobium TaxID=374 RepID=UPI00067B7A1E|nr:MULTISPECIES: phage minor head protein [Bradyrhizobium]WOH83686.1 phage minor head protein [Bradyrhizobium sp. BEA-2-5]
MNTRVILPRKLSFRGCCCGQAHLAMNAVDVAAFSTDPLEAIRCIRDKLDVPTSSWTDLWQQQHSVAFTVAGATSKDLVRDFHDAVNKAIEDGTTLEEFQKDFDDIVEKYGWSYNGSRGWRSSVIFDTNVNMAYAAGRWDQIQQVKARRPYLMYKHLAGQVHPRAEHEAWDGTILPVDDPWWQTHFPPNGWFCHCWVESLSDADLDRYGYQVSDQAPPSRLVPHIVGGRTVMVPEGIDPGFAYRPGEQPAATDDE